MFQTETLAHTKKRENPVITDSCPEKIRTEPPDNEDFLELALDYFERGQIREADALLTSALLEHPGDEKLWLAAGLCRLRRGAVRSAACAFEMGAWLTGDPAVREICRLLEEIAQ